MHVRDVMTRDVVTVTPGTSYKEAVTTMLDHDISALPVVDSGGGLHGIVTEADLLSHEAYGPGERRPLRLLGAYFTGQDPGWLKRAAGRVVVEFMTPHMVLVRPDDDIRRAARRMLSEGVKHLVVVDDGGDRLVGIVSRHDLLRVFARADAEIARDVTELLADVWRTPERVEIEASVKDGVVHLEGSVLHPSDRAVVEQAVLALPGVIDVDSGLEAREPEPRAVR